MNKSVDVSKFFKELDYNYDPMFKTYLEDELLDLLDINIDLINSLDVGTVDMPLSVFKLLEG